MQDGHGGYLVRSGFPLPLRMFAKLAGVAVYPPCGLGHNHEDQETCGKFQAANDKAATMARVRDIVHDHIDYAFEDDKEALVKALVNAMCKKEGS